MFRCKNKDLLFFQIIEISGKCSFVVDEVSRLVSYFDNFGNFNVNNLTLVIINISISNIWIDN